MTFFMMPLLRLSLEYAVEWPDQQSAELQKCQIYRNLYV